MERDEDEDEEGGGRSLLAAEEERERGSAGAEAGAMGWWSRTSLWPSSCGGCDAAAADEAAAAAGEGSGWVSRAVVARFGLSGTGETDGGEGGSEVVGKGMPSRRCSRRGKSRASLAGGQCVGTLAGIGLCLCRSNSRSHRRAKTAKRT